MLVDSKVKTNVDQASSYLRRLAQVWAGSRDVSEFLEGDAKLFWESSFPKEVCSCEGGVGGQQRRG